MNKLLVSDIINLKSGSYVLEVQSSKVDIFLNGNITIYFVNENFQEVNFFLEENSDVFIYDFRLLSKSNLKVNIKQINRSKIHYNYSFKNRKDNECIINNDILGNDNESYISIRNISELDMSKIIINVMIDTKTKNNIALEDLKGINAGGNVQIEPNITSLSNEVEANHLTTIGSIPLDSLLYLMSKGIDKTRAEKILLKGFIYSNMDNFIKEMGGEINA